MPTVIGKANRVVEVDGVLAIDELVGNVATSQDTLSVARTTVQKPTSEPWLTFEYDEWICVTKGGMEISYEEGGQLQTMLVNAGEIAFVGKKERIKPSFLGGSEYLSICHPAFTPDRCYREEEGNTKTALKRSAEDKKDTIYHMCEKNLWEAAVKLQKPYFPPTFESDGGFTHATSKASMLLGVANHYYTQSKEEWICLALSESALLGIGIVTRTEEAKPVGNAEVFDPDARFPHIFGGIPAHVPGIVKDVFPIKRSSNGAFLSIEGLPQDN